MGRDSVRRAFRRYASPTCVVFGLVCGLLYASAVYFPVAGNHAARLWLASLALSAGPMAIYYLWTGEMRRRHIPFLWEQLTLFFLLWTAFGAAYGWLTLTETYVPEDADADAALVSFVVGMIAGTVWIMAAILLLGKRLNVAIWDVERFPLWIGTFAAWAWRRSRRGFRRRG